MDKQRIQQTFENIAEEWTEYISDTVDTANEDVGFDIETSQGCLNSFKTFILNSYIEYIPQDDIQYILQHFDKITTEELYNRCRFHKITKVLYEV